MSDARAAEATLLRRAILEAVLGHLPGGGTIRVGDPVTREFFTHRGFVTTGTDADELADAAVLADGEFSQAGEHAETLLAETVATIRPGGHLIATFPNALIEQRGPARQVGRAWRPRDVEGFLGSRGLRIEELWGPGAFARVNGHAPAFVARADAEPSLLGAAPTLLVVARTPVSSLGRSEVFFATLPGKTIAAATLTRHPEDGTLLIVHDSFKKRWTIPGGVVDADEDPETAAIRETREESGLHVRTTGLLGVFHAVRPDRLTFLFGAEPAATSGRLATDAPTPIHTHEIDAVRWVDIDEALACVAPHTAEQIRSGLAHPGRVWRQH